MRGVQLTGDLVELASHSWCSTLGGVDVVCGIILGILDSITRATVGISEDGIGSDLRVC